MALRTRSVIGGSFQAGVEEPHVLRRPGGARARRAGSRGRFAALARATRATDRAASDDDAPRLAATVARARAASPSAASEKIGPMNGVVALRAYQPFPCRIYPPAAAP